MQFEAPFPAVQTVTVLPEPQWNDTQRLPDAMTLGEAMNGDLYSNVAKTTKRVYNWSFNISRMKALEFLEFVRAYSAEKWRVTDHEDVVIIGYLLSNPLELNVDRRAKAEGPPGSEDNVSVTIEFEGEPQ